MLNYWADDTKRKKGSHPLYEVVHEPRIAIRCRPNVGASIVSSATTHDTIEASEVFDGWVKLSRNELRRRQIDKDQAWALVDGSKIGLGPLLKPLDAANPKTLTLRVLKPTGEELTSCEAFAHWGIAHLQDLVEAQTGIPKGEQRYMKMDAGAVDRSASVGQLFTDRDPLVNSGSGIKQQSYDLILGRYDERQDNWWLPMVASKGEKLNADDLDEDAFNDLFVAAEAVKHLGAALELVSQELKDTFIVVHAAVSQDGKALRFASARMKANREVVLAAVQNDPDAVHHVAEKLLSDAKVVSMALDKAKERMQQTKEAGVKHSTSTLETIVGIWRKHIWAEGTAVSESLPPVKAFGRVTVHRSQKDANRQLHKARVTALGKDASGGAQAASVFVCPRSLASKPFLGFGGSFTEAAATTFAKISPANQMKVMRAYFDRKQGLGYGLARLPIGSCDFGHGNWLCGDLKEGDTSLSKFSLAPYEKAILPMMMQATSVAGKPLATLASPWSPPPWMKTIQTFNGEGHLRPDCCKVWARHFVRFIIEMAKVGVPIWGVSVQNEPEAAQPWESCIYTAQEELRFVRDHLGPALQAASLSDVKILAWDHNRDGMLERASELYGDEDAAKYIWGIAYHWYGDARFESWPDCHKVPFVDRQSTASSDKDKEIFELRSRAGFQNVRLVAELRPDKHILHTESCQELGGRPLESVIGDWKHGERYAMNIIADLNNGCEGWIDWNLILDQTGGPNHKGNYCMAPIICDVEKDLVLVQSPYWYIGHFARFIQPGARRALCSSSRDVLEVTAFVNPDGSLAVVVMNQSNELVHFWLKVAGAGALWSEAPPHSITTLVLDENPEKPVSSKPEKPVSSKADKSDK